MTIKEAINQLEGLRADALEAINQIERLRADTKVNDNVFARDAEALYMAIAALGFFDDEEASE